MKNLHLIPTDKPSRLWTNNLRRRLELDEFPESHPTNIAKHLYITSDEKIKEGDYFWKPDCNMIFKAEYTPHKGCQKVILTTDQDLIKEGVQAIDDEFLEWFVKNPVCEEVEVGETYPSNCCINKEGKTKMNKGCMERNRCLNYKIIIPKEEINCFDCNKSLEDCTCMEDTINGFEQQTTSLEEAAEKYADFSNDYVPLAFAFGNKFNETTKRDFIEGAKWQEERMYSEEEVYNLLCIIPNFFKMTIPQQIQARKDWFEQFKKKES